MVLRRRLMVFVLCLLVLPAAASAARPAKIAAVPQTAPTLRTRLSTFVPWKKRAPAVKHETHDTFADHVADVVARETGSFRYYAVLATSIAGWMAWNTLSVHPIDPPPFTGMNTFISVLTLSQQFFLQMSQNRQSKLDQMSQQLQAELGRRREAKDHRVNLKAEREVRELAAEMSARFDELSKKLDKVTANAKAD